MGRECSVDDNAFTNGAVIKALQYAVSVAKLLEKQPDRAWELIAENLTIPKMDNGVIREHATYYGEQINPADVNLLAYPLGIVDNQEQIKKTWNTTNRK